MSTSGETIACRRCAAHASVERAEDGAIIVPPGWRHVVILTAGPGTRLLDDGLDVYKITEGMFLWRATVTVWTTSEQLRSWVNSSLA